MHFSGGWFVFALAVIIGESLETPEGPVHTQNVLIDRQLRVPLQSRQVIHVSVLALLQAFCCCFRSREGRPLVPHRPSPSGAMRARHYLQITPGS